MCLFISWPLEHLKSAFSYFTPVVVFLLILLFNSFYSLYYVFKIFFILRVQHVVVAVVILKCFINKVVLVVVQMFACSSVT